MAGPEAVEPDQPQAAGGNLSPDQMLELTQEVGGRVWELWHKAHDLGGKLTEGNVTEEAARDEITHESGCLKYWMQTERGLEYYSIQPTGSPETFTIVKSIKLPDGEEKSMIIASEVRGGAMTAEILRNGVVVRRGPRSAEVPNDAIAATTEQVIGTLTAKVAERESNSSDAIAADIADILGTDYPPQPAQAEAPEAPPAT